MKNYLFIFIVTITVSLFVFVCGGNNNTTESKENSNTKNTTNSNQADASKKIEKDNKDDGLIWLVGNINHAIMQRVTVDNGLDAVVGEQKIAGYGIAFMHQRKELIEKDDIKYPALSEEPAGKKVTLNKDNFRNYIYNERQIIAVRGKFVTDKIKKFVYDENPNGGKPTSYHHEDSEIKYFLADDTIYIGETVDFKLENNKLNITINSVNLPVDIDNVNINLVSDLDKPADNTKKINLKKGEKNTFTMSVTDEEMSESWLMITNTKINCLYYSKVKEEELPKHIFFFGLRPRFVDIY